MFDIQTPARCLIRGQNPWYYEPLRVSAKATEWQKWKNRLVCAAPSCADGDLKAHQVSLKKNKKTKQEIKTLFTLPYWLKWQAVAGLWVSTLCNSHYTVRCEKDALVSIQLWSRDPLSLTVPIRGERGEGRRIRQEEKETIEVAERGRIDVDLVRWWGREVELFIYLFFAE